MNWKFDKILHYNVAYKFGKYGSIIGFLLITFLLSPGKELYDFIHPYHKCEWNDYKAGVIGAWDGMLFKKNRFK